MPCRRLHPPGSQIVTSRKTNSVTTRQSHREKHRSHPVRRIISMLVPVAMLAVLTSAPPAMAQIGDVPGPGQPVSRPAAQCPQTVSCTYDERTLMPAGVPISVADHLWRQLHDSVLDQLDPRWEAARRGAAHARRRHDRRGTLKRSGMDARRVRTIVPSYGASDPACCPSSYVDTTYTWDNARGSLVPGEPVSTPMTPDDEIDWVDAHDMLLQEDSSKCSAAPEHHYHDR